MARMTERTQTKALTRTLIAVAIASVFVVAARMIWPKLLFDSLSLTLFGIAAGCLVLVHLPFKKLKFGDFEAELDAAVDNLEEKVVASESAERPGKRLVTGAASVRRPPADTWRVF